MAYSAPAFFYSKDWSLFLFLKGVARPCRALKGHGCNGECLHSQRHPGHFSTWCFAPTPFIKFFFHIIVLPALSFVAHIIKTPYLCPTKRKYPSCTKARPTTAPVRNPSPMICNSRVTARFLALW